MKAPGYIIREARERKGLTVATLSKASGISTTTIVRSEQSREISPKTWAKLKIALGIEEKQRDMGDYLLIF